MKIKFIADNVYLFQQFLQFLSKKKKKIVSPKSDLFSQLHFSQCYFIMPLSSQSLPVNQDRQC